ncbi:MAG: hypothetical protein ACP5T2_04175 [Thermoprotei archaeon]
MEAEKEIYEKALIKVRLSLSGVEYDLERRNKTDHGTVELLKSVYLIKISVKKLEEQLNTVNSNEDFLKWKKIAKSTFYSLSQRNDTPIFIKAMLKSIADEIHRKTSFSHFIKQLDQIKER